MAFSSSLLRCLGLKAASLLRIGFLSLTAVAATGCDSEDLLCLLNCVDASNDEGGELFELEAALSFLLISKKFHTFWYICFALPWVMNS